VYASQPLSPVATQHSLSSGRYSLLEPDLHRLDRTSFAWRTYSFISSVPFAGLLCRFWARHGSKKMLGVLVVVFCSDYIAGLGLGLG
jgi:hypothetical protein